VTKFVSGDELEFTMNKKPKENEQTYWITSTRRSLQKKHKLRCLKNAGFDLVCSRSEYNHPNLMMRHERSRLLITKRFILIVVIRVDTSQLELFGISDSVNSDVAVRVAVRQPIGAWCFGIGLHSLAPCADRVKMYKHIDDYAKLAKLDEGSCE
jgi:hypothetical protein